MKLLFDMSNIHAGDRFSTGLVYYAYRSLTGFDVLGYDVSIICLEELEAEMRELFPRFPLIVISARRRWLPKSLDEGLAWRRLINASDCDLAFLPYPTGLFKFLPINIPFVMTVHDIQFYRNKKWYQAVFLKWFRFPLLLHRARLVISISEFVRGEILKRFRHLPPAKVKAVRNAIEVPSYSEIPIPVEGPFIVTVNNPVPYKNIITLLRAMVLLKDRIPHRLVIVGKNTDHFKTVLQPFIDENGLSDRVIHIPFASEDLLFSLYGKMDLFVTTSLMEGLGATPIEAAMMGGPVISTRETALPESTMEMVDYYEPATDPEALAARILETLSHPDKERWEKVKTAFRERYSNENRARELYETLCECVKTE